MGGSDRHYSPASWASDVQTILHRYAGSRVAIVAETGDRRSWAVTIRRTMAFFDYLCEENAVNFNL